MSATFVETDHPRNHPTGRTRFSDKPHSEPEVDLSPAQAPAKLDQFFDTLEAKLAAMREEIDSSVEALADDENWNRYLDTMSRFHNYSFGNQQLIEIQWPDATRVAGKRVWESLGRKVKPFAERGNGISLLAPKRIRVALKDDDGKPLLDSEGKPRKESKVIGFTSCTVYDVSQTEGDELPSIQRELTEEPPDGFIEDLESAITARGYTVSYKDSLGVDELFGRTSKVEHTVEVKAGLSAGSRAQVLAHELGHIAAGHLESTADYHTGAHGKRGAMEVEAESISHVLLRVNGMQTPGEVTGTYIAGWARTQHDDPDVVKNAGETVSRSVRELLSGQTWKNVIE
jgi:hypothetical protein